MRTLYTYEQYAEWHKSSGGVATDGIRLVGSDPSSWPDRYAAQSRIVELEAEVARLNMLLVNEIKEAYSCGSVVGWNDAIEACKSDVKEWGHLWSDEYYGYEMMGEILSDLEALKR